MEPFLKSVGGKRWLSASLAREIMAIKPDLYIEPFVGGGAVALALPPELPKVVADANGAFITVWQVLRKTAPEQMLQVIAAGLKRFPDTALGYTQARESLNHLLDDPKADPLVVAALVIYINHRCFNGVWRVNSKGTFNVPWANYKSPGNPTLSELKAYHAALQNVEAVCGGFRVVLHDQRYTPRTALYADPPYDGMFTGYTVGGFDETDQRDLAKWLKYLAHKRGVHVWATNADTPLIREIYSWAKIEMVQENHLVSGKASGRGDRGCLLIRGNRSSID